MFSSVQAVLHCLLAAVYVSPVPPVAVHRMDHPAFLPSPVLPASADAFSLCGFSGLLSKSKPSDEAVIKLHDCIEKVAVTLGQDSTDVFRALLAKLIEEPEEKQTFDRLLEMAEKLAAKH